VTYAYNTAARLTGVTNNGQVDWQNPATPASAMHYNAFGGLTTDTLGDAEVETFNYDKRLRMQSYTATINSPNYYSTPITLYSFSINSFAPNGDILSANDSVNGNWTYSYDPFNRLVGANQNNGAAVYSYVYDRFGNRWQQNGPTNTFVATFTGNNQSNPQNNNRIDGYTHDAAGNIMSDGLHNYTYDAENRLIQVDGGNTATYVYDADGHRVQKTSATGNFSDPAGTWIFFYDQSGRWVQKFNSPNNTFVEGQIYAGSRHLASVGGWTTFSHSDWLGTERLRLGMGGIPYQTESCASLPFGDGLNCTGSDVDPLHFTGKERDAATGLDNFGARYYSSPMGRFGSPDWSALPEAVPYADFHDPQSLNLYSYVRNNPMNQVDLDGHDCDQRTGKGCFWQKFKNYIFYGEFVTNNNVEAALAKHPAKVQNMRDYIKSQHTNISAEDLDAMPNKQVMDIANRVKLEEAEGAEGTSGAFLVPFIDATGKVHSDLPNGVPENWTREEMEEGAESLRQSIKNRKEELLRLGEESGHRERIRQEERLLRQLEKKLSGS
jgi:RHS repeat-associated protein